MRVLVTGASGFLGRRLVTRLAASGAQVGALALDALDLGPEVEWLHVDIRDADAVERTFAGFAPESVVHLAALAHVGESWRRPADYFAINVAGADHVFRAARARGAKLLFASSAEVYGEVPESEQPIVESRSLQPRSPYALTKAAAELLALRDGATVVRAFNLVGPGQAPAFALPSFAEQLARLQTAPTAERVLRVGNLAARRDFVHVDDAIDGLLLLLGAPRPGEVFNLASGVAYSIQEALDGLIAVSGLEVRLETDPGRFRPVDVAVLRGDARRLRALGWSPQRTLAQALAAIWRAASGSEGPPP